MLDRKPNAEIYFDNYHAFSYCGEFEQKHIQHVCEVFGMKFIDNDLLHEPVKYFFETDKNARKKF